MEAQAHSSLGASSMDRWSKCPASVRLSVNAPKTTSTYAEEGTRAHEIAADVLNGKSMPEGIDEEMKDAIEIYVTTVKLHFAKINHKDDRLFIEHRFDLSQIYKGMFGTADAVIYDGKNKRLTVYDFKYGKGKFVSPKENPQLMYYGLGALMSLKLPAETVELAIVQPRFDPSTPLKVWEMQAVDLIDFAADLFEYAKATEPENAPLNAGDHCQFCPAKITCPLLSKNALEMAKKEFKETELKGYGPKEIGGLLDKLDQVETWIKGVREFAYQEAQHGRTPVGYKLVPKRATRKWNNPEEAMKRFNQELNSNVIRDLLTEPELKSPAQVEKVLGKPNKALVDSLCSAVSSGDTLVPADDDRQEVKKGAVLDFANIKIN